MPNAFHILDVPLYDVCVDLSLENEVKDRLSSADCFYRYAKREAT